MLRRLARRLAPGRISSELERVPGAGTAPRLPDPVRWQLAGEYSATHQLTGPWYRRGCGRCGTKGGCPYRRWADDVLAAKARHEWLAW